MIDVYKHAMLLISRKIRMGSQKCDPPCQRHGGFVLATKGFMHCWIAHYMYTLVSVFQPNICLHRIYNSPDSSQHIFVRTHVLAVHRGCHDACVAVYAMDSCCSQVPRSPRQMVFRRVPFTGLYSIARAHGQCLCITHVCQLILGLRTDSQIDPPDAAA